MSRVVLHFPGWAKAVLYSNVLMSLATGSAWFALHRWVEIEGEFGPEKSPLEPWLMRVHGASAFLILIGFGYLLASHIHVGWRAKRNRFSGLGLVGNVLALICTGYLLYYASGESFRDGLSWTHLALGLSLPVTIALHVWRGHRTRRVTVGPGH